MTLIFTREKVGGEIRGKHENDVRWCMCVYVWVCVCVCVSVCVYKGPKLRKIVFVQRLRSCSICDQMTKLK